MSSIQRIEQFQQSQQVALPVWILKWRLVTNARGRRHAAVFIPNTTHVQDHPLEAEACAGTMYNVTGSPFGGFGLNIRRNWDSAKENSLSSAHQVAWINQQHVWTPTGTGVLLRDIQNRGDADKVALNVRPPGVTSRPWVAEEVMDCQDWILDFIAAMIQRKYLVVEVLQATQAVLDVKTALMPAPSGASTDAAQPPTSRLQDPTITPITGSTVQNLSRMYQQTTQQAPSQRSTQ